jgi:DNA-binding CsgD family transcriptional regulator
MMATSTDTLLVAFPGHIRSYPGIAARCATAYRSPPSGGSPTRCPSAPCVLARQVNHGGMEGRRSLSPFVGRDPELVQLNLAMARVDQGLSEVVVVTGEAGIGKTRLLHEFVRSLRPPHRVLWGACLPTGGSRIPHVPLVTALHGLASDLGVSGLAEAAGPGRRELARLLPELGPAEQETELSRTRLLEACAVLLERMAKQAPVVMVIEDLHWADSSTLDLVSFLAATLRDVKVLLALSYRPEGVRRDQTLGRVLAEAQVIQHASPLELSRLGREDVETIIAARLGATDAAVVDNVTRRSDGVPFFVEELATPSSEHTPACLPESLRAVLLARAERLSDQAGHLTRAASLAGQDIPADQLRRVVGMSDCAFDMVLREVVESGLLRQVSGRMAYQVQHTLLAEAIAEDMLPGERARLHRAWAVVLEADSDSPLAVIAAAHHWFEAGEVAAAFAAALQAAEAAGRLSAPGEQMLMLERALALWDQLPDPGTIAGCDRANLAERAAEAAWRAGHEQRADALLAEALNEVTRAEQPTRYAHLLVRRARMFEEQAASVVGQWLREALELNDEPGWPDRFHALLGLAVHHSLREEAADSVRVAMMALRVARGSNDRAAEALALAELGPMLARSGHIDDCLLALDQAHAAAQAIGDATALVVIAAQRSAVMLDAGRFSAAAEAARTGGEVAHQHVVPRRYAALLACNEVDARTAAGQWADALALAHRVRQTNPPRVFAAALDILVARILVAQGSPQAPRAVHAVQHLPPEVLHEPQVSLPRAETLGRWALSERHPLEAAGILSSALRVQLEHPDSILSECWPVLHALAEAIQRLGAGDDVAAHDAAELVARVKQLGRMRSPWREVVDAELDGDESAWAAAVQALTQPGVEGPVYLRAYAQYRWALGLAEQGRQAEAVAPLSEACLTLQQIGATPLLNQLVQLARREHLPLPAGSVGSRTRELPYGLTERELGVLTLLADGRSNAAIAQDLGISVRTAAVHVSHILAKLGVCSRTEAAAVAHRHALVSDSAVARARHRDPVPVPSSSSTDAPWS